MSRRSYRILSQLPAWGLFGVDGDLVATVRAEDAQQAADLFEKFPYSKTGGVGPFEIRKLP